MIYWRPLFDHLSIQWRDKGSNCSRGNVNITCPWCGPVDPSYHLTINEETGAYYCLRTPGKMHSGRSLPWLLIGLGVSSSNIDRLISDFSDNLFSSTFVKQAEPVKWAKFAPAVAYPAAVDYLKRRGYSNPNAPVYAFDLRFALTGQYSWRILFPLTLYGKITGFTGRAIRDQEPRYLTNDPFSGSLFIPPITQNSSTLLLCEGPFDAMAMASVTSLAQPVAILGNSLTSERLLHIDQLAKNKHIVYVPDSDQPHSNTYRLLDDLESCPSINHVNAITLPREFKDIAEILEVGGPKEIAQWAKSVLSRSSMREP